MIQNIWSVPNFCCFRKRPVPKSDRLDTHLSNVFVSRQFINSRAEQFVTYCNAMAIQLSRSSLPVRSYRCSTNPSSIYLSSSDVAEEASIRQDTVICFVGCVSVAACSVLLCSAYDTTKISKKLSPVCTMNSASYRRQSTILGGVSAYALIRGGHNI